MVPGRELTSDEFKELADFWSEKGDAISLYFQARACTETAHREEPILAKEKIRQKLKTLHGNSSADRADIARVLDTVAALKGNHGITKVIFTCGRQKFWREYDVPGEFGVRLDVGCSFTLATLLADQQKRRRYLIALADRNQARLLLLEARRIVEHAPIMDEEEEMEKIRTTGARKSVHLERKKEERVRQHFAFLANRLVQLHQRGQFDALIVGCRGEMWPEIEQALHPQLKRLVAGRFTTDPGLATHAEIAEKAQAIINERDLHEEELLLERVAGSAASGGLGALGLDAVIAALEKREVRTLLFPQLHNGTEHAVALCSNCGHLEQGAREQCDLCGGKMRGFSCAEEALLRHGMGRSIEMKMLTHAKLPPAHVAAAWLRFRADRKNAVVERG